MKAALISGSPKRRRSGSEALLNKLQTYMKGEKIKSFSWSRVEVDEKELEEVMTCDTMVIAFPLYIDGIPSHLLSCLEQVKNYISGNEYDRLPGVVVIVNNGFYEPRQSRFAIQMMKNWCIRAGLKFSGGLCVGAGGIIISQYNAIGENGPFMPVNDKLKEIAEMIKYQHFTCGVEEVVPTLPRGLYKKAIHRGWNIAAKKNGLKKKDLSRQQ